MSSSEDVQHHQVTQSTILLLLQEATKLSPPADGDSASHVEKPDTGSLVLSGCKDSVESEQSSSSSAWDVMRLINQQCERLLQSGHEDLRPSDVNETSPERPAVLPAEACFSVIYEIAEEPGDLAETHTADHISVSHIEGRSESVVPSTRSDCPSVCPLDFTSCLLSESVLNVSECVSQLTDLNNNLLNKERRRKQPRPERCPDPQDPGVQGVTFSMTPLLDAGQSRLVITSNYRWSR